jgi:hypothetical protein
VSVKLKLDGYYSRLLTARIKMKGVELNSSGIYQAWFGKWRQRSKILQQVAVSKRLLHGYKFVGVSQQNQ